MSNFGIDLQMGVMKMLPHCKHPLLQINRTFLIMIPAQESVIIYLFMFTQSNQCQNDFGVHYRAGKGSLVQGVLGDMHSCQLELN